MNQPNDPKPDYFRMVKEVANNEDLTKTERRKKITYILDCIRQEDLSKKNLPSDMQS